MSDEENQSCDSKRVSEDDADQKTNQKKSKTGTEPELSIINESGISKRELRNTNAIFRQKKKENIDVFLPNIDFKPVKLKSTNAPSLVYHHPEVLKLEPEKRAEVIFQYLKYLNKHRKTDVIKIPATWGKPIVPNSNVKFNGDLCIDYKPDDDQNDSDNKSEASTRYLSLKPRRQIQRRNYKELEEDDIFAETETPLSPLANSRANERKKKFRQLELQQTYKKPLSKPEKKETDDNISISDPDGGIITSSPKIADRKAKKSLNLDDVDGKTDKDNSASAAVNELNLRRKKGNFQSQGETGCPLCSKLFPAADIENHASYCEGKSEKSPLKRKLSDAISSDSDNICAKKSLLTSTNVDSPKILWNLNKETETGFSSLANSRANERTKKIFRQLELQQTYKKPSSKPQKEETEDNTNIFDSDAIFSPSPKIADRKAKRSLNWDDFDGKTDKENSPNTAVNELNLRSKRGETECPLCSRLFPAADIESHASNCEGRSEKGSPTIDENINPNPAQLDESPSLLNRKSVKSPLKKIISDSTNSPKSLWTFSKEMTSRFWSSVSGKSESNEVFEKLKEEGNINKHATLPASLPLQEILSSSDDESCSKQETTIAVVHKTKSTAKKSRPKKGNRSVTKKSLVKKHSTKNDAVEEDVSNSNNTELSIHLVQCPVCSKDFSSAEIEVHASMCESIVEEKKSHTKCDICSVLILTENYQEHRRNCIEELTKPSTSNIVKEQCTSQANQNKNSEKDRGFICNICNNYIINRTQIQHASVCIGIAED